MQLKHDSQGFLVGELIAGQRDMLESQQSGLAVWRNIRTDVRSIARLLGATGPNARPAQPAGRRSARAAASGGAATPAQPGARGASQTSNKARTQVVASAAMAATKAVIADRDSRGRFRSKGGAAPGRNGGGGGGAGDDVPSGIGARISERLSGIASALKGVTQGTEQVDPAVAAMHEVKEVIAPFGRGMFALLGRSQEKKKERWYKRLLGAITGKKSEQSVGGGMTTEAGMGIGAIAGGVARILPLLLAGLGTLLGGGLAALLGTKIGGAIYDWLDKSGIATKIFDTFDAAKDWITDKVGRAKQAVGQAASNYTTARDLARSGGLDASGRRIDDPRRLDAPTGVAATAGRIVGSVHRGRDYMAGGRHTTIQKRALETAGKYSAGNIGGLNDAQTRALVASTVATESRGGELGLVNSAGYMGRYQAGAGWLADAGLIKGGSEAVKAAMKADGFSNEYKWGKSGGMTRFLKNEGNWNNGLSYDKYLASGEAQDSAFKTNSDKAYADMVRRGLIGPKTTPAEAAGLLKARHLAGMGGAAAVAAGGAGPADANGTTARKYFHDMTFDRGGYMAAFSGSAAAAGTMRAAPVHVPSPVPGKLPEAEAVTVPSPGAAEKDKPVRAVMREPIGQDVGDRKIAHIVSGGIGG